MYIIKSLNRNYVHRDFSYLIHRSSKETAEPNEEEKSVADTHIEPEKQADDQQYPYFKYQDTYHDISCGVANRVPNDSFEKIMLFSDAYNWCPKCYRAALIRSGISDTSKPFKKYYHYFNNAAAGNKVLDCLIVEHQAKFRLICDETMEFTVREDRWRITIHKNFFTLLHNNYYVDNEGRRVFEKTFHIQIEKIKRFSTCMHFMIDYTWEEHLLKQRERESLEQQND